MKKVISIIAVFMAIIMCFPFTVNADNTQIGQDFNMTDEEFFALENSTGDWGPIMERTSGLISSRGLSISKSGTTLYVKGYTECVTSVTKCGFSELVIQRRKTGTTSWSNFYTFNDLYINNCFYSYAKSYTVATGYQYRATCVHYAKKSLLSTQKISNSTGYLTF